MTQPAIQFFRFRPHEASPKDYEDMIDLIQKDFIERQPNDPVPSRSTIHTNLKTREDYKFTRPVLYIVRNTKAQAIGWGSLFMRHPVAPDYDARKHHTYLDVNVMEEWRRQGIGKQILQFLVERCIELGITVIEGDSYLESGQGFAEHIGAKIGLTIIEVEVYLKNIDWEMVEAWVQAGQARNPDTKIVHFRGLYSEDDDELTRFVELESAIRDDMPDGDLEGFKQIMTADKLREELALEAKQGIISDYMLAVEGDGRLSGFTRINYRFDYGHKIEQRVTGVLSSERGRGLGKWLKAKMLLHIREHYPNIDFIHTGSANINAPMASINTRIGFEEVRWLILYTMSIETAKNYLNLETSQK